MEAILISIKPEHALNILKGNKTLELRKSIPKGYVGWVYEYVTKSGKRLARFPKGYVLDYIKIGKSKVKLGIELNGTIPFRFWFDEYYEINHFTNNYYYMPRSRDYHNISYNIVLDKLCLSNEEVGNYGKGKDLYAWHIKKLEIFDKPMQLSEFYKNIDKLDEYQLAWFKSNIRKGITTGWENHQVTKAHQSLQYVWVKEEIK